MKNLYKLCPIFIIGLLLSCGDPTAQKPGTKPGTKPGAGGVPAAFTGKVIDIPLDITVYTGVTAGAVDATGIAKNAAVTAVIKSFIDVFATWRPGAAFAANEVGGAAYSLFVGAAGLGANATIADDPTKRDAVEAPLKALADYKAKLTKAIADMEDKGAAITAVETASKTAAEGVLAKINKLIAVAEQIPGAGEASAYKCVFATK